MSDTCEWKLDDGFYQTECDNPFAFETGYLWENGFTFCPYCGKEIVVKGESG